MSRLIRRLFDTVHQVSQRPTARAPRRPVRRATDVRARLLVQALEGRVVPANFPVSTSADAGAGSLRQAILDANANPGADTITFDAGVAGPIVLLTGELAVTDDLTITGPGAAGTAPTLVVDGNAAGRVFNLTNAAAVGNITLRGLIVQNGLITTGDGAGIFTSNENVTLDRMIVRNNVLAGGGSDSGAGIGVASVTVSRPSLDDVYLRHTGRAFRHTEESFA